MTNKLEVIDPPVVGVDANDDITTGMGGVLNPAISDCYYNLPDNTIRLKFVDTPDKVTVARLRAVNFRWWPSSNWNVATWTTQAEDLALELSGLTGLEVLEEDDPNARADDRATRFTRYSGNAASRAESIKANLDDVPDGPILIGHNNPRFARRVAEKSERAMKAAADELDKATYWKRRAIRAVQHALFKDNPGTIMRRIDRYEAERRKHERSYNVDAYDLIHFTDHIIRNELKRPYPIQFKDLTPDEQAQVKARRDEMVNERRAHEQRWLDHLDMVIGYQQGLYQANGGGDKTDMLASLAVGTYFKAGGRYFKVYKVNKKTVSAERLHGNMSFGRYAKIDKSEITDVYADEDAMNVAYMAQLTKEAAEGYARHHPTTVSPVDEAASLRAKAKALADAPIVKVDQLFPTPTELAITMVDRACLDHGLRVLEPSAGTGALVRAVRDYVREFNLHDVTVDACEVDANCRRLLIDLGCTLVGDDFLGFEPTEPYDVVIMNPPFANNQAAAHIRHAYDVTRPGGVVIAIADEHPFFAADTPSREFREFMSVVGGVSEKLPASTFKVSGTTVNTRLITIHKRVEA